MITLCVAPHIFSSTRDDSWKKITDRLIGLVVCVALDCIYIVPMCL